MDSSSISSSFGGAGVSEISCDLPSNGDAKLEALSSSDPPAPKLVMVVRDHGPVGSSAAFFKESMRRDAMTGTKIGCTLLDAN